MKVNCGCDCNGQNCAVPACSSFCNPQTKTCFTTYTGPTPTLAPGEPAPTGGLIACTGAYSTWYCQQGACGGFSTYLIRFCLTPANSNQYQIQCADCGTDYTPAPTDIPPLFPTATPSPTPAINWIKLKNTSFYADKRLTQNIPAAVIAYDADDDASPNFIIASLGSDPGLVSATSINLGSGQPSTKGRAAASRLSPANANLRPIQFCV